MPKLSFADPLPVGMVGLNEVLFVRIRAEMSGDDVIRRMNQELPDGLSMHSCELVTEKHALRGSDVDMYTVLLPEGKFNRQRLEQFLQSKQMEFHYSNKKGVSKTIDLKRVILSIDLIKPNRLQLSIRNHGGKRIRPAMVLKRDFDLPDDQIKLAAIIKGDLHV